MVINKRIVFQAHHTAAPMPRSTLQGKKNKHTTNF